MVLKKVFSSVFSSPPSPLIFTKYCVVSSTRSRNVVFNKRVMRSQFLSAVPCAMWIHEYTESPRYNIHALLQCGTYGIQHAVSTCTVRYCSKFCCDYRHASFHTLKRQVPTLHSTPHRSRWLRATGAPKTDSYITKIYCVSNHSDPILTHITIVPLNQLPAAELFHFDIFHLNGYVKHEHFAITSTRR